MIKGIGIDIVRIARMEQAIARWGTPFLTRIFHPEEIAYSQRQARPGQHFSARFAAKEALLKSLQTGIGSGIAWREIVVRTAPNGAPRLDLQGKARCIAEARGVRQIYLSLSHDQDYAIAQVILEGENR
ncbi:MAG: holo-[acyl-carrier-protein] synthase [Nitrospinota bacterium]|nr:MAG: holo-[acyl-carrier-protein] synthase [Nitrospinota bacterium]